MTTARTRAIKSKLRSNAGASWQHLYKTKRWQAIRGQQLAAFPLCQRCDDRRKRGLPPNPAKVCHHVNRHMGDPVVFYGGPFQSLCSDCHDGEVQQEECLGFSKKVDADGWPVDERHPFNRPAFNTKTYSIPHSLRHSAVPVVLVCGPPGAGKTTYVRERKQPSDVVIDFDDITETLGGIRYTDCPELRAKAFKVRDEVLRGLAVRTTGTAWLIIGAPTEGERQAWARALGKVSVHCLDTPPQICITRILADPQRQAVKARQCNAVDDWLRARATEHNETKNKSRR